MDVEQMVKDRAARVAAAERQVDEVVTVRVGVPGDHTGHEIRARVTARFTRAGGEWVRWEPVDELTGALAFYNGWSKGTLALPASRVVDA